MNQLLNSGSEYRTRERPVSLCARLMPSVVFYRRLVGTVFRSSSKARRGQYDSVQWFLSSLEVLQSLESIGANFEITGIEHYERLETPCVFIGNHMSLLDTLLLPIIICPIRDVTFVIKASLLEYPVFKHIMRSRHPIAVTRTHPRQDLKTVLKEGVDRLQRGISVIVFPQTTRSHSFDPTHLNSIGVKLARKAGVPVIPMAMKTDILQNGKFLKDFGRIIPSRKVHFSFAEPLWVKGRGTEEHETIIEHITEKLRTWKREDGNE